MTIDIGSKPLVSFILLCYNQEGYIREAVSGALSQTYSPLEIILSDDCSSDNTFSIMEYMVSKYRGPHKVLLNRNSENYGIARHLDKIYQLAHGELLVNAAGDDISYKDRVKVLVHRWELNPIRPSVIFSNAVKFSELCDDLGLLISSEIKSYYHKLANPFQENYIYGSTAAIDRSIVDYFAPIEKAFMSEDALWFRRAHFFNGVAYVNEPLVKYRIGIAGDSGNISHVRAEKREDFIRFQLKWAYDRLARCEVHVSDVLQIDPPNKTELLAGVWSQQKRDRYLINILEKHFLSSLLSFGGALADFRNEKEIVREFVKQFVLRWLPMSYWFMNK